MAKRQRIKKTRPVGRPPREAEAQIRDHIIDAATARFFAEGYGATSIETIAKQAGISKRTFYARFDGKADLFNAVVHRLIERLRPPNEAGLFKGGSFAEILQQIATVLARASLTPEALALYRIVVAEANRFPELVAAAGVQGARAEAIRRIAALLEQEKSSGLLDIPDTAFAAEQFIQLIVSVPQRRALGFGPAMTSAELDTWIRQAIALFLNGCGARR